MIDSALLPILALAGIGAVFLIKAGVAGQRRVEAAWQLAASRLGLPYQRGFFKGRNISGPLDGFFLTIDTFTVSTGKSAATFTRVVLQEAGGPRLHPTLAIKKEGTGTALKKLVAGEDIQIGDAAFDRTVNLNGPELEVLAMMSQPARRAVEVLLARGGVVRKGEVYFQRGGVISDAAELVDIVKSMVAAAHALAPIPGDQIPARLAAIAGNDDAPGVRLRALGVLESRFAGTEASEQAAAVALASSNPALRFMGAKLVAPSQGLPVFEELLAPGNAAPELRVQVLEHLAKIAVAPCSAGVRGSLADPDVRVQSAAVRAIGAARDNAMSAPLAELGCPAEPELARALARALGRVSGPEIQAALLALLGHDSPEVRQEAAEALGTQGSLEAVEPLLGLTHGLLANGPVKSAARDAIHRIQSRLGDAEAGRLALVETRAVEGALSLAGQGGELSVASEGAKGTAAEAESAESDSSVRASPVRSR